MTAACNQESLAGKSRLIRLKLLEASVLERVTARKVLVSLAGGYPCVERFAQVSARLRGLNKVGMDWRWLRRHTILPACGIGCRTGVQRATLWSPSGAELIW